VINSRESGFSRILKSEGGYWVPETLVEQSKTRNEHGSGTQIGTEYHFARNWFFPQVWRLRAHHFFPVVKERPWGIRHLSPVLPNWCYWLQINIIGVVDLPRDRHGSASNKPTNQKRGNLVQVISNFKKWSRPQMLSVLFPGVVLVLLCLDPRLPYPKTFSSWRSRVWDISVSFPWGPQISKITTLMQPSYKDPMCTGYVVRMPPLPIGSSTSKSV
jgi:hypothetical protein